MNEIKPDKHRKDLQTQKISMGGNPNCSLSLFQLASSIQKQPTLEGIKLGQQIIIAAL